MHLSGVVAALGLVSAAQALFNLPKPMRKMRKMSEVSGPNGRPDSAASATLAYFDQLIDHSQPSLGTFKQRYYYDTMYYKGPGSPISMESPSEAALPPDYVDGSNATMPGFIAQQIGGAYVTLEHRFYGASTPLKQGQFDTKHLQQLTLENAVDDLVYFARNVKLPFDPKGLSHPDKAPWMLSGCSYSGALSAWTQKMNPGTFWAHEAGSAVVETRNDLWQYYLPIEGAMPKNCTADWKLIMAHVDDVLLHGSDDDKIQLKRNMGVTEGTSDIDTAMAADNWLYGWQNAQYGNDAFHDFFSQCDYIENQVPPSGSLPGPEGVGLEKALAGWFNYMSSSGSQTTSSGGSADPWDWQLCNEPFQWWQSERPDKPEHMTSALISEQWFKDAVCHQQFPPVDGYEDGLDQGRNETTVNKLTGGWEGAKNLTRIAWVNADYDPWLYATVSSPDRPGGPQQSAEDAPLYFLHGTAHCNDYITDNYFHSDDARKMFDGVAAHMKKWAAEFYEAHNIARPA